ncbi:TraR/DksA family transcriptional regulator [Herbaspirillum camelliae]|uniref:TraR/DksA family transcriptional regulator n=1 Tax=Herbaspirillum camelliae TaxID=1892903 RepID=UPI000949E7C6|nr:TraR/DksA C4-type zinc finger protein [Herbaspirillum camelliae]
MRHLSTQQLVRLRSLLDTAESALRQRIQTQDFAGDDGEDTVGVRHLMSDQDLHELLDITNARSRMQDNSYGICVDCGIDIDVERLLAYPTAKRCLDCQRLREQRHAHLFS